MSQQPDPQAGALVAGEFSDAPVAEMAAQVLADPAAAMEMGAASDPLAAPEEAPMNGSSAAGMGAGAEAGAAVAAMMAAGPAGDTGAPGAVTTTVAAAAVVQGGAAAAGFQLSENVGLSTAAYKREAALPSDRALLKLLVTESRILKLWNAIDALGEDVESLRLGSQDLVSELIDRLTVARNLLLHSRDSYEDAEREVVIVRHRLLRVQRSSLLEQPQSIVVYLVLILILLGAGFAFSGAVLDLLGRPGTIAGIGSQILLNTLLWGGVGGLAAAFFALQRHVLDFDQQHARWFYLSPIIGLFIGPLIALVAELGLPGLFVMAGGGTANMTVTPLLLYLLAWAVGFQQNLLLRLINKVFTTIFPDKPAAG